MKHRPRFFTGAAVFTVGILVGSGAYATYDRVTDTPNRGPTQTRQECEGADCRYQQMLDRYQQQQDCVSVTCEYDRWRKGQ